MWLVTSPNGATGLEQSQIFFIENVLVYINYDKGWINSAGYFNKREKTEDLRVPSALARAALRAARIWNHVATWVRRINVNFF